MFPKSTSNSPTPEFSSNGECDEMFLRILSKPSWSKPQAYSATDDMSDVSTNNFDRKGTFGKYNWHKIIIWNRFEVVDCPTQLIYIWIWILKVEHCQCCIRACDCHCLCSIALLLLSLSLPNCPHLKYPSFQRLPARWVCCLEMVCRSSFFNCLSTFSCPSSIEATKAKALL